MTAPPVPLGHHLLPEHGPYWAAITAAYPGDWSADRLRSAAVGVELLELIGVLQGLRDDGNEPSQKRGALTLERTLHLFVLILRGLDRPG